MTGRRDRGGTADGPDRTGTTDGRDPTGTTDGADADDAGSMADVDHEPPYPEPNDVWTRGFKRADDVGTDE